MPLFTHILDFSAAPESDLVVTMLCGAQCIIFEDATTAPKDFDFYAVEHGHKANCPDCKQAKRARAEHRAEAIPA